jgi:hypothetical protein
MTLIGPRIATKLPRGADGAALSACPAQAAHRVTTGVAVDDVVSLSQCLEYRIARFRAFASDDNRRALGPFPLTRFGSSLPA